MDNSTSKNLISQIMRDIGVDLFSYEPAILAQCETIHGHVWAAVCEYLKVEADFKKDNGHASGHECFPLIQWPMMLNTSETNERTRTSSTLRFDPDLGGFFVSDHYADEAIRVTSTTSLSEALRVAQERYLDDELKTQLAQLKKEKRHFMEKYQNELSDLETKLANLHQIDGVEWDDDLPLDDDLPVNDSVK